jgi:FG-GAP repeat protein
MTRFQLLPVALPFAITASFVIGVRGNTLLDPLPENSTTRFGQAIVTLGDVNADGVPDLAVAAPFQDGDFVSTQSSYGRPQNVGKIFILDGATLAVLDIMNDPEFEVIQPQHFGGQLGSSLAAVADLNGDGVADLIAGVPHHIEAPEASNRSINGGEAFVFSGKDGTVLFTLSDPTAEEDGKMGVAVAGLGDVDADAVPDLLVGVPGKDIGGEDGIANVGLAYIFSGKTGKVIRTLNHPPQGGSEAGAAFGSAVANAGDLDQDGVTDILIGAPGEGHAFVFSGQSGNLIFTIVSPVSDSLPSFGTAVAAGKDFNHDGKPDLVIGSPLQEGLRGAAYIFNGSDGSLQRRLVPAARQTFARFGASLCVSDDLTGDRRPDIAVGAPGQTVNDLPQAGAISIFDGRHGKVFQTLTSASPQAHAFFGAAVTTGDFDNDRLATVVAGTPDQDANIDSGMGVISHLEIGQIEVQP